MDTSEKTRITILSNIVLNPLDNEKNKRKSDVAHENDKKKQKRNNEVQEKVFNYLTGVYEDVQRDTEWENGNDCKDGILSDQDQVTQEQDPIKAEKNILVQCDSVAKGKDELSGNAINNSNLKNNTPESYFKCCSCPYQGESKKDLINHIYIEHLRDDYEIKYKCTRCNFESEREHDLKNHELIHVAGQSTDGINSGISPVAGTNGSLRGEMDIPETIEISDSEVGNGHGKINGSNSDATIFTSTVLRNYLMSSNVLKNSILDSPAVVVTSKNSVATNGNYVDSAKNSASAVLLRNYLNTSANCNSKIARSSSKASEIIELSDSDSISEAVSDRCKSTIYKCFDCDFVTHYLYTLKSHSVRHLESSFRCDIEHFRNRAAIQKCLKCIYEQRLNSARSDVYTCAKCSFKTCRKEHFERHQKGVFACERYRANAENKSREESSETKTSFRCFDCDFRCDSERYFERHAVRHSGSKFQCDQHLSVEIAADCEKCVYVSVLKEQASKSDSKSPENDIDCDAWRLRCYDCDYTCYRIRALKNHAARHAGSAFRCASHATNANNCPKCVYETIVKNIDSVVLACSTCDFKTCRRDTYEIHKRSKISCERYQRRVDKQANETESERDKVATSFRCFDCDSTGETKASLKLHSEQHHLGSNFRCDMHTSKKNVGNCGKCIYESIVKSIRIVSDRVEQQHQSIQIDDSESDAEIVETDCERTDENYEPESESDSEDEVRHFACGNCDFKTFHRSVFQMHKKSCDSNGTGREPSDVVIDISDSESESQVDKVYECFHCDYRGTTKTCLKYHAVLHYGNSFKCDQHSTEDCNESVQQDVSDRADCRSSGDSNVSDQLNALDNQDHEKRKKSHQQSPENRNRPDHESSADGKILNQQHAIEDSNKGNYHTEHEDCYKTGDQRSSTDCDKSTECSFHILSQNSSGSCDKSKRHSPVVHLPEDCGASDQLSSANSDVHTKELSSEDGQKPDHQHSSEEDRNKSVQAGTTESHRHSPEDRKGKPKDCNKCVYETILKKLEYDVLICEYCQYKTCRERAFEKHKNKCGGPQVKYKRVHGETESGKASSMFKCFDCSLEYATESGFKNHAVSHIGSGFKCVEHADATGGLECQKCVYENVLRNIEDEVFTCAECGFKTHIWVYMELHKKNEDACAIFKANRRGAVIKVNDFKCYDCDFRHERKDYLKCHAAVHLGSDFRCDEHGDFAKGCGKCVYQSMVSQKTAHRCFDCNGKCFSRAAHLRRHVRLFHWNTNFECETHRGEYAKSCETCAYEQLVRNLSTFLPKCFFCNDKTFDTVNTLKCHVQAKHARTGSPSARFECGQHPLTKDAENCGMCFFEEALRNVDAATTTTTTTSSDRSTKKHRYSCFDCDYRAVKKDLLKRHVRRKHKGSTFHCTDHSLGEIERSCEMCNYENILVFIREGAIFDCPNCNFEALSQDAVDEHVKKTHAGSNVRKITDEKSLDDNSNKATRPLRNYLCYDCGFEANSIGNLQKHLNRANHKLNADKIYCQRHTKYDVGCARCIFDKIISKNDL